MTRRNASTHPVTELQQAILALIWSKGSATAEEVREGLLPKHPLKDPSVRTLPRRLGEGEATQVRLRAPGSGTRLKPEV